MSGDFQSLNSIAPMAEAKSAGAGSAVQSEYEEGKKCLADGNYGQAALALHNALVGFEEKNDTNGVANACNQLGHLCLARKDYEKALAHYKKALVIVDEANDRMSVLALLKKMVDAYAGGGQYDQAVTTCLEMLDHYHDNRDPQGTVETLEKLATIYLEQEQKQKAADTYRTVASIHKNFNHATIAKGFEEKADALEKEGDE